MAFYDELKLGSTVLAELDNASALGVSPPNDVFFHESSFWIVKSHPRVVADSGLDYVRVCCSTRHLAEASSNCLLCSWKNHQEEARVEIVEEAGEQGFVVEDMAGEILVDPITDSPAAAP